jgi:hypothetical protein
MNTNYNYAQKYAMESAYGYTSATTAGACNGHLLTANTGETFNVSGPLNNCLTNCKQYLPLALMGQVQLNFTLDAMANIMGYVGATAVNTTYTITNFELCYELYHPSNAFMDNLRARGGISLKTLTYPTSTTSLPAGSKGNQVFTYNIGSFKSIKSAFLLACPASATAQYVNGGFDCFDPSQGQGDFQFQINNVNYPQKVLSSLIVIIPLFLTNKIIWI